MSYEEQENGWSSHSRAQLDTCHPDLITLFTVVLRLWDCKIQEGYRPKEMQDFAVLSGNSHVEWPDGNHNSQPSLAADVLPFINGRFIGWGTKLNSVGKQVVDVEAMYHWYAFAGLVVGVAHFLHKNGMMLYKVRWGGDWDSDWNFKEHPFRDLPHWELEL